MMKGVGTQRFANPIVRMSNLSLNFRSHISVNSFAHSATYYILTLIQMNMFALQGGRVFAVPGMRTHNVG
jgi:hypothetical protein